MVAAACRLRSEDMYYCDAAAKLDRKRSEEENFSLIIHTTTSEWVFEGYKKYLCGNIINVIRNLCFIGFTKFVLSWNTNLWYSGLECLSFCEGLYSEYYITPNYVPYKYFYLILNEYIFYSVGGGEILLSSLRVLTMRRRCVMYVPAFLCAISRA